MSLTCKIIESKGDETLIEIAGQKISVPKSTLPPNLRIGGHCMIFFWDGESKLEDKNLAKEILEEILNGKQQA